MDLTAHYQTEFSSFWSKAFPNKPCPALPKSKEDLGLMEQLALQNENPILYQNLFRSGFESMPADTATRLREDRCWREDIPILREHGWEHKANQLEEQVTEAQRLILEKQILESQERQKVQQQQRESINPYTQPLSPETIARTRREWGISGEPIF